MPRHPDAIITPNTVLAGRRKGLRSPYRPGQQMSRPEFADAINRVLDRLYPHHKNRSVLYVDARWVGKLERGESRWPSEERRAALRHILDVATDIELGLFSPRRTIAERFVDSNTGRPATDDWGHSLDDFRTEWRALDIFRGQGLVGVGGDRPVPVR